MTKIKLHQDVAGGKRGEEVDVPADQAKWFVEEGYASTPSSDGEDKPGEPVVHYERKHDPRLPENRENPEAEHVHHEATGTTSSSTNDVEVAEAYEPGKRSVADVKAYFEELPDDAGGRAEADRVKAVEAKGKARPGILEA